MYRAISRRSSHFSPEAKAALAQAWLAKYDAANALWVGDKYDWNGEEVVVVKINLPPKELRRGPISVSIKRAGSRGSFDVDPLVLKRIA